MNFFQANFFQKLTRSRLLKVSLKLTAFCLLGSVLLAAAPALAQEGAAQGSGPFAIFGQIQQALIGFVEWINGLGPIAPIVFIFAYIGITVAFLPASVVTLGAGFVFGVIQGSILVFIGAMLGATAAFLVGRFVARDWIAKKVEGNQFFNSLDNAIAEEGLKLIFLIRLSPAFPFNLLNYALGLTKVSLKDYVIGTTGIIPGTIMYVYLGSLVGDVAMLGADDGAQSPQEAIIGWVIRILIFVTIVAISLYIGKIAKKALNESVPAAEEGATDMA
ncbi:MAG: TVP38/TMEM64 family protein [Cyanobacteria bacterium J06621_11]